MTFADAVEQALYNNYSIILKRKTVEIAQNNLDNKLGQSGATPKLDATAGYQYQKTDIDQEFLGNGIPPQSIQGARTDIYSAGIQLSWTVFDGFAMWINMDRLELIEEKSQIEFQIEVENTIRSIAQVYYNGAISQQNIVMLEETISKTKANLARLKARQEYGQSLTTDILRAEVNINNDASSILQSKLAYDNARYQLNMLLGRNQEIDFELSTEIEIKEVQELRNVREVAMNQNNAILLALRNKELSKKDYDLVISQYYPKLTLTGSYSFNRNESEGGFLLLNQSSGYSFGANLNWNIFNGFQTKTAAENAAIQEEMMDVALQQVRNTVDMNVMVAYDNLTQRLALLELEKNSLRSAERNYERSQELYSNGQVTSLELRDAQLQLLQNQTRISTATYMAKLAEIELEMIMGRTATEVN